MEENLKQQPTSIIKIAFVGPESTGKTTLSNQLATHYKTVCVPEFARAYLQEKLAAAQEECSLDDLMPIAIGQTKLENESLTNANSYLFCDTNLLVTQVFSEINYSYCDSILAQAAQEHHYDLTFLTQIDVPWEADGLRNQANERETNFEAFNKALIKSEKPFITLSGDAETRLATAILILDELAIALQNNFSSRDYVQMYQHGIPYSKIASQLKIYKTGVAKTHLLRPAILGDGILNLTEADYIAKASFFDENKSKLQLEKFVPASGAASRMFKFLNEFLNEFDIENETINAYINRKKANELQVFIVGMDKFPFFEAIYKKLKEVYSDFDNLTRDNKNYYFIKMLLASDGFDYANKPKGILPFHKYFSTIASPIEEHLYECGYYCSAQNQSLLHFTISQTHQEEFENIITSVKKNVEKETNNQVSVSYSYQNKSTDVIAVDGNNVPFRTENGQLFFRPGGHGALIENLNNLYSDIVFIKNIDNVIQHHNDVIALYKKALAGILIEIQKQVFAFLHLLDIAILDDKQEMELNLFLKEKLHISLDESILLALQNNKAATYKKLLNKPIRVCGMVKNEGEAGGGPFWVQDAKNQVSLQIVETAQVDLQDIQQEKIVQTSTHFNPVDLVCGIKDYKGNKFDLTQFVDADSGFIVYKNTGGKEVKSYELPGLWNGAMGHWISLFVAVPLITFNPVKTVNDLLKAAHQPQ